MTYVIACWLFGHDFIGQPGNFCIHCGKRPDRSPRAKDQGK